MDDEKLIWRDEDGVLHTVDIGEPEDVAPRRAITTVANYVVDSDRLVAYDRLEALGFAMTCWIDALVIDLDYPVAKIDKAIENHADEATLESFGFDVDELKATAPLLKNVARMCGTDPSVPAFLEIQATRDLARRWAEFALDIESLLGHLLIEHGMDVPDVTKDLDALHDAMFRSHVEAHQQKD